MISPEEFEQLRRKELETLQAAAVKTPPRIWNKVFRDEANEDLADEFIWVPIQPYESLLEMVARIEKGCGQAAQHAICEQCASGSTPEWEGFDLNGRQIWLHQIQVADEPHQVQVADKASWLDRLAQRLGYIPNKTHSETVVCQPDQTHSETIVCPASRIIQEFMLLGVPATMPGVNTGAYPPDPKPYGDPMAHRMGDE
jgi:hypothetical protein